MYLFKHGNSFYHPLLMRVGKKHTNVDANADFK